jgi:hypothetical protein
MPIHPPAQGWWYSWREDHKIIASLKYDAIDHVWWFERYGQFVGIEENGYMHT